jgi:hypothetical protein
MFQELEESSRKLREELYLSFEDHITGVHGYWRRKSLLNIIAESLSQQLNSVFLDIGSLHNRLHF